MYSRTLDGEVLTISASGWTYDNLFVLYDWESESMWYHLPGTKGLTCIAGAHKGSVLDELYSEYVSWAEWFSWYPTTKVLPSRGGRPGS